MKYKSLANGYPQLTAEERFRLLMAALGRGDDVEHAQLCRAGRRITLSMDDHAPYAIAFNKAALIQFIQLLDHAARFEQAVHLASRELLSDRHEESFRRSMPGALIPRTQATIGSRTSLPPATFS